MNSRHSALPHVLLVLHHVIHHHAVPHASAPHATTHSSIATTPRAMHYLLRALHRGPDLFQQVLPFLRILCLPELIHLLLHFFHILLSLRHLFVELGDGRTPQTFTCEPSATSAKTANHDRGSHAGIYCILAEADRKNK